MHDFSGKTTCLMYGNTNGQLRLNEVLTSEYDESDKKDEEKQNSKTDRTISKHVGCFPTLF